MFLCMHIDVFLHGKYRYKTCKGVCRAVNSSVLSHILDVKGVKTCKVSGGL